MKKTMQGKSALRLHSETVKKLTALRIAQLHGVAGGFLHSRDDFCMADTEGEICYSTNC